jgi:uncharacterized protein
MKWPSSRRDFLAVSMLAPAAAPLPQAAEKKPAASSKKAAEPRYRTLGRTGLKVTTVGFGCMTTSDASVIERAADMGINYFDTARGYQGGNNERMVGAALKSRRKNIVLSSKSHGGSREEALKDLDTSLRELGTDFVDIWYLHAKSKAEQVTDELQAAQAEAKKQGKIRFAGVSTHAGQPELIPALAKLKTIDVVLSATNFSLAPEVEGALETAANSGMGVVAMKVMAGGFRRVKPGDPIVERLKRGGAMQAALKWAIRKPFVHTSIPGIMDLDQLDENYAAMTSPLSEADEKVLKAQLEFITPLYCRTCLSCTGACAKGLPVPELLRFLMYAEGYGEFALGRERYLELAPESVAGRCADCGECTVKCPNGVHVATRVARAQELFA